MKPETFNEIYDLISPRLNVVGDVRTVEAWAIVNGYEENYYSFDVVCKVMRLCLFTMMEQHKAIKVQNGVYRILKPNERTTQRAPLRSYIKHDLTGRRKKKLDLLIKLKDHLYNQVKQSLATDAEIRRLHSIIGKIKKLKEQHSL